MASRCLLLVCLGLSYGTCSKQTVDLLTRWTTEPPTPTSGVKMPVERTFSQKKDHFDSETKFWNQRYFVNEQFYKPGGPVFVLLSDNAVTPDWLIGGHVMELAIYYHAVTVYLEHRFYGASLPTNTSSVRDLHFLTLTQAVQDALYFTEQMKQTFNASKAVHFGGGYAGNLAVWARLQNPGTVNGAVASSAPLLAQLDYKEFFEQVATVMSTANADCTKDLEEAIQELDTLTNSEEGAQLITKLFQLCDPLDHTNDMDLVNIYTVFANLFANSVLNARSLADVTVTCDLMTNPVYGSTPFDRLTTLVNLLINTQGCFHYRYQPIVELFRNTSWDSPATLTGRKQFLYLGCTQFAHFQTTNAINQPFGNRLPVNVFVQNCKDFYDDNMNVTSIQSAVDNLNAHYGGLLPAVSQVVFVQGSLDPYRLLGVTSDLSGTATAILIEGVSHMRDMATSSGTDPPQLTEARMKIRELVGQWLSQV